MPSFTYTAIDNTGSKKSGGISSTSRHEAVRALERQRLTVVKIVTDELREEKTKGAAIPGQIVRKEKKKKGDEVEIKKLNRNQIIFFTEELSDLLEAGLQLEQALHIMEERQDKENARQIANELRSDIREGSTFANALKKFPSSFDDLYINMTAAGEASGSLPPILKRLAKGITVIGELQTKVIQALIYPLFMILLCFALIMVFALFLIPQLSDLMSQTGQELPLVTQFLMHFSDFMLAYWWVIIAAIIVIALLFKVAISRPEGRIWWDEAKLKIPLAGPVMATRLHAGFCHSLGNLVKNGVPLFSALKLVNEATPNTWMKTHLVEVENSVKEGGSLSKALEKTNIYPSLMTDIVGVGEHTGKLGNSLGKAAQRYDKELDVKIKRLTTLIPTVAIIMIATIVGVVAYSIVTSIMASVGNVGG